MVEPGPVQNIVVTITRDKESLTPLLLNTLTTFKDFKRQVSHH